MTVGKQVAEANESVNPWDSRVRKLAFSIVSGQKKHAGLSSACFLFLQR